MWLMKHMSEWNSFLTQVQDHLRALQDTGCDLPFFRGHSDSRWTLSPSLGRQEIAKRQRGLEALLYYDFISLAGPLSPYSNASWDILFLMQHHGVPTRLLDWTQTFSIALYFSLRPLIISNNVSSYNNYCITPCIWILDPFNLNESMNDGPMILNPNTDIDGTYQEHFIENSKKFKSAIIAINPSRVSSRVVAQRGVFTLHSNLSTSLEEQNSICVKKFDIPKLAIPDAISFLYLSGVNEFSVFPDLDGLARFLRIAHI